MHPLPDKSVKTIATVIPEILQSTSKRKRVAKEAVMASIESFLIQDGYKGTVLNMAKTRIQRDLEQVFGPVKTFPKDKLGDELHFTLRYMHLAGQPRTFMFVDNTQDEIKYYEFTLNSTLSAEEIQKIIPGKVTRERFEKILTGSPYVFTLKWFRQAYTESRQNQFPKIYAHKKGPR